jgi:hypothetical protein
MNEPNFNREVEWPGRGRMTLAAVFLKLREFWGPTSTISVCLFVGRRKEEPPTVIEAWPELATRRF